MHKTTSQDGRHHQKKRGNNRQVNPTPLPRDSYRNTPCKQKNTNKIKERSPRGSNQSHHLRGRWCKTNSTSDRQVLACFSLLGSCGKWFENFAPRISYPKHDQKLASWRAGMVCTIYQSTVMRKVYTVLKYIQHTSIFIPKVPKKMQKKQF